MTSIGFPKERKDGERRVVLDPGAVGAIVERGHQVRVEQGAGLGAGFADDQYRTVGAQLVSTAEDAWDSDVVVKVKEPIFEEYRWFRPGLRLFCYLHLAAQPDLIRALTASKVDAFAFETLEEGGRLPLLSPMSEVAGRAAAIIGAYHLASTDGGSGQLLGGAAGAHPARVAVIGLGVAGSAAARGARGLEAEVTGIDVSIERLRHCHAEGVVTSTVASTPATVGEVVQGADLVIGAALVPGARAPIVVSKDAIASMAPGSVVIDLAIDQGGCIETARPTSHSDPTYIEHDVLHYCVTNVPGRYAQTASRALSAVVGPKVAALAEGRDHELPGALNTASGDIVHAEVRQAMDVHNQQAPA